LGPIAENCAGAKLKPSRLPGTADAPNFPHHYSLLFWEGAAVPFLTETCDWSHSPLQLPTGVFGFGAPYGLRHAKSSTHSQAVKIHRTLVPTCNPVTGIMKCASVSFRQRSDLSLIARTGRRSRIDGELTMHP
jgi:hypothetical protein